MNIYISYWYQVRFFPENMVCLSTVVWPPKYKITNSLGKPPIIIDCIPLKPNKDCEGLCNGSCNPKHPQDCDFLKTYSKQLNQINFNAFMQSLQNLSNKICQQEKLENIDFACIVFESPKNICSERQALINWFNKNNIFIKEWQK